LPLSFARVALSLFASVVAVTPWSSWSARGYAIALIALHIGLLGARPRRALPGAAALLAVVVLRVAFASHGVSLTMTSGGGPPRMLARVLDERDVAVWGARFRDPERPAVAPALIAGYQELRAYEGDVPSPVLPTYLGLEGQIATDVLAFDAAAEPMQGDHRATFVGGSFTLPCWQLARAVATVGFRTRCPALGPKGDWWSADGEAVLRAEVHALRGSGVSRVVLLGLSNGAVGAARLAPKMRGEIHALVLVSGATPAAAPGVPVLVLQGHVDAMMPAAVGRAYATAHGGTYVELEGGHFALLLQRERAMAELTSWLAKLP
jgi:hypothetical protein